MITFASTEWETISLIIIFLLGFPLTGVLCKAFKIRLVYGFLLYIWHSLFCVAYILYSMTASADTINYFLTSLSWNQPPTLGTRFVVYLTSFMTQFLSLSYGGAFFVYNLFGACGLLAFAAALKEALWAKSPLFQRRILLVPFLPSFSFWTTAIGKDSIAFLSIGLICWASARPSARIIIIGIGIAIMLSVRPHMAAFLVMALVGAYAFSSSLSAWMRTFFTLMLIPFSIAAVTLSLSYVGLDGTLSSDSLTSFIEQRQSYNTEGGSSLNIAEASVPMRLFAYVFRPLFFDAPNTLGLMVSFESLFLLILFFYSAYWLFFRKSSLTSFQWIFFAGYIAVSWIILANTTANTGIAIRQKTMFTPMLFMMILSYLPNYRASQLRLPRTSVDSSKRRHFASNQQPLGQKKI